MPLRWQNSNARFCSESRNLKLPMRFERTMRLSYTLLNLAYCSGVSLKNTPPLPVSNRPWVYPSVRQKRRGFLAVSVAPW
jgi:hypothetical protein